MASNPFLKFDGVEGQAVDGKLHQEFRAIGTDFSNIGNDFLKLIETFRPIMERRFSRLHTTFKSITIS
jgi:hypothetical protein